jgi:hypothetical protein
MDCTITEEPQLHYDVSWSGTPVLCSNIALHAGTPWLKAAKDQLAANAPSFFKVSPTAANHLQNLSVFVAARMSKRSEAFLPVTCSTVGPMA